MAEWNEPKIAEMIANKVEESSSLDWKQSDSLINCQGNNPDKARNELSKEVSSFANAGGGILVYGVTEEKQPPHRPTGFDDGCDPSIISKELIDNLISSRIHPNILRVGIIPIQLNSAPGRCAYVIDIPQSHTVHQAHDKRYYRRRNFQAEPMEDYEVREGMLRSRNPIIEVQITWSSLKISSEEHIYELHVVIENIGPVRARDLMFQIDMPSEIEASDWDNYVRHDRKHIVLEKRELVPRTGIHYRRQTLKTLQDFVLFPTERIGLAECNMRIKYRINEHIYNRLLDCPLTWQVYADDALPRSGEIMLRNIQKF